MDMGLSGSKVMVFGAAAGIGKSIADAFTEEGAEVIRADQNRIENSQSIVVDISDYDSLKEEIDKVGETFGHFDHIVCAAAIGSGKFGFPFWNLEPGDWKRVLEVTLMGSVHVAHACRPWILKGVPEGRSMLFLTSVAGQIGSQTDPPYSAAKAGIINFVQCAARDFAPYGVRVNALSPGMVKTSLNESVWASSQAGLSDTAKQSYEEWAKTKIGNISPLGKWQEVEEFGSIAVYLASRHAASITGQTINIDGGQVMHS